MDLRLDTLRLASQSSTLGCEYTVRPAVAEDNTFLYDLIRTTMRQHVEATWGTWDEEWQHNRFTERFKPKQWQIILESGRAIGGVCIDSYTTKLFLANLHLLPDWQRRGIGTAVVTWVLEQASARGFATVRLNVLRSNNSARRFYERLGFHVDAEDAQRYWLSYEVPADVGPTHSI